MSKTLVRQEPNKEEELFIYDNGSILRFKLDEADREVLESGKTLFRGDTAFILEDEDR